MPPEPTKRCSGDVSPALPIFIGCPVWNCDAWGDQVYPAKTPRRQWLRWYTRMFNSVEGNSSFYAIPTAEQTSRWASESVDGFRFCLKFPREISHERKLRGADSATQQFLAALQPLARADRLGPTFLQLGPDFGPDRLSDLAAYLGSLPSDLKWAVEVRHLDWFDRGQNEAALNDMLREQQVDKVLFDSRALFQAPPEDEIETISQSRKPRTPVRQTVTAGSPMLRLVGRNRIELTDKYLKQWAEIVAGWVAAGLSPFVFLHAPDDQFAPALTRRFWDTLVPLLPQVCAENKTIYEGEPSQSPPQSLPRPPSKPRQLDLL